MKHYKLFLLLLSLLQIILILSACSSSNQETTGVARIENTPTSISPNNITIVNNTSETESKTDEVIVTEFTECMRNHGVNVPDPELNADSTVDFQQLRDGIFNNPNFQELVSNTSAMQDLRECFSILGDTTFVQERQQEDPIELQDDLLKLAQCLRDNGLDVPDPDFSDGPRASMRSIVSSMNIENDQVQETLRTCRDNIFSGTQTGRQGPGSGAGGGRQGQRPNQ